MRRLVMLATLGGLGACSEGAPLQGEPYVPRGDLAVDPASVREASASCDASSCEDAGRPPLPSRDAGAEAGVPTPPTNTCETARDIGSVAGDEGSTPVTAQGTCAEFVRVRVVEANSNAVGAAMRLSVTLSPAGHDFDLYAFLDPARDQLACASPFARSETNGVSAESVGLRWGEGSVANGTDDGRTVVLAVTSASGPCPPGATWSLTATGNK
jgi:hypothetical protein